MAVNSVEDATSLALEFTRKYYSNAFPVSTRKQNAFWVVDLDVSYYRTNFARLRIDQETGIVEEFKITQSQLL